MIKENLGQKVLMEVLTQEIETLKASGKTINQVVPALEKKLNEIKDFKVTANINQEQINEIKALFRHNLNELERKLPQGIVLPNWLIISFITMFFFFAFSIALNVMQHNQIKEANEITDLWYDEAVKLGYKAE